MLTRQDAESQLRHIPRFVAVVANLHDPRWLTALGAVDAQLLTVSVYRDHRGRSAHQVEGRLNVRAESLGLARFSAIDNSLRLPRNCGQPVGSLQIVDQFGNLTAWTSRASDETLWLTKDRGPALITHDAYVQIQRPKVTEANPSEVVIDREGEPRQIPAQ